MSPEKVVIPGVLMTGTLEKTEAMVEVEIVHP